MRNSLAEEVRKLSYTLGINLTELSRRANVDRSTITRWMHGDMLVKNLESILLVLGISLRDVVHAQLTKKMEQPNEFVEMMPTRVMLD